MHVVLLTILLNTVSDSELLKRDFIQLKDTLGNLPVRESQAVQQHKTRGMKCFTTPLSLHQHVWHIEGISMTTLTFSGGAEKCFKRMESTDPWSELRCYTTVYYHQNPFFEMSECIKSYLRRCTQTYKADTACASVKYT